MKQGYRLILVDKNGVLVSEFPVTERDLADPEVFVGTLKQSIGNVEEEELCRNDGRGVRLRKMRRSESTCSTGVRWEECSEYQ